MKSSKSARPDSWLIALSFGYLPVVRKAYMWAVLAGVACLPRLEEIIN